MHHAEHAMHEVLRLLRAVLVTPRTLALYATTPHGLLSVSALREVECKRNVDSMGLNAQPLPSVQ